MCHCSLWTLRWLKQLHIRAAGRVLSPLAMPVWLSWPMTCQSESLWHKPVFLNPVLQAEAHPMSPGLGFICPPVLGVFYLQLPFVLLSWICSYLIYQVFQCNLDIAFCPFFCSCWQWGKNPFVLWSQVFHFFVTSRLLALTLFPFPVCLELLLLWTLHRKQSCFPGPSVNAE